VLSIAVARRGTASGPEESAARVLTALDAVIAAAAHLHRPGHRDIRRAEGHRPADAGLTAPGLPAGVEPPAEPVTERDVECLWPAATARAEACVCFSVAGHTDAARVRADAPGVPLFVLGPTGAALPVNGPAERPPADGA
jgi:2-keto-4-pentenoate hydratase/2-oxohepta-3-ene-1,7-dioic acid hydratase in catechol pathway